MNRKAKGLRIAGGIIVLLNIILLFLPMTKCVPVNYPVERYSQWDYIVNVFTDNPPYESAYTGGRVIWMIFFILIPVIVCLMAGIWGIVGNDRQIVSSIMIIAVLVLYFILFVSISGFFPREEYTRDIAGIFNLICSGIATVVAIISMLYRGEELEEPVLEAIPNLTEIKQEQIVAKYNIISETSSSDNDNDNDSAEKSNVIEKERSINPFAEDAEKVVMEKQENSIPQPSNIPAYVPGPPRGVLVGLTGLYAGAEIPFHDGESINLGRLQSNDLIFDEQEKVSRNHCCIRWDGNEKKFYIKDVSSNGTFIQGMEDCLPQNIEIEIPIGSVIELGDESNTFRFE